MSLKIKTIPYATIEEKRNLPFTMELELAALFTIAEAQREREPLSAIARVYYPLHIHSWDGGALLIDLLGLNHASIGYNIAPDVEGLKRTLEDVSDDPGAFLEALKKSDKLFKELLGRKTIKIKGLLVKPKKEAGEFLADMCDFESMDGSMVLEPVLKRGDIESITDSLRSLRNDIDRDLRSLERVKRSLKEALYIARKVVEEEIQNIRDRSAKIKTKMRGELKKTKRRYKKMLEPKLKKIRKEYSKQVAPFTRERRNIKSKLARRRRKLEELGRGRSAAANCISREISGLDAKLKEEDRAISSLRAWRDAQVEKAKAQYNEDLRAKVDKIEEGAHSRDAVLQKKKEISGLVEAAKRASSRIGRLIRSKKGKLGSLSRFRLDVEVETVDLYIPFYIFRYGRKKFGFYPPVEASSTKGSFSRFKWLLAENLQSRATLFLKPRAEFIEKYLARAVRALGRNTGLTALQVDEEVNLLRRRGAIDKTMKGLVKMRQEGWISDSEYIRLQGAHIEKSILRRGGEG